MRHWIAGIMAGVAVTALADTIVTSSGEQTGEIVRVDPTSIVFKIAAGEISIPRSEVSDVRVDKPAAFDAAINAFGSGKYADAVAGLKPLVDRLCGLDIDWVEDATLRLGDALVANKSYADAKAVFDRYKQLYPSSPKAAGLDAKYARILVEQKKFSEASALLAKLVGPLMAKKAISQEEELAVAEGLVLLGDCQRGAGKLDDALDSYLNVCALFDVDASLAAEAKYKAGQIFEEKKNWRRAKSCYRKLSEGVPQADIVADSKKRLAALTEAHPD